MLAPEEYHRCFPAYMSSFHNRARDLTSAGILGLENVSVRAVIVTGYRKPWPLHVHVHVKSLKSPGSSNGSEGET